MCRHLAYLGPSVNLAELLLAPRNSLLEQTWAPKNMRDGGTINVDGFGVGWYPDSAVNPVRYRAGVPMWTDTSFAEIAEATSSHAVLAAVRSASAGMTGGTEACQPLSGREWLFSHNGKVDGWPGSLAAVAKRLDFVDLMTMEALFDSAVVWALLRQSIEESDPATSVRQVVAEVVAAAPESRMNLLLTDGHRLIGTTWTHSLAIRRDADSVTLASEPFGHPEDWEPIPDRRLVVADRSRTRIVALDHQEVT